MYRHAAYEMLSRLKLDAKFRESEPGDDTQRHKIQKALSRAAWGIFCFERYFLLRPLDNNAIPKSDIVP